MAHDSRSVQQGGDIDVVPLRVRVGDVESGNVIQVLLNPEVGDRLLLAHARPIEAIPFEYNQRKRRKGLVEKWKGSARLFFNITGNIDKLTVFRRKS